MITRVDKNVFGIGLRCLSTQCHFNLASYDITVAANETHAVRNICDSMCTKSIPGMYLLYCLSPSSKSRCKRTKALLVFDLDILVVEKAFLLCSRRLHVLVRLSPPNTSGPVHMVFDFPPTLAFAVAHVGYNLLCTNYTPRVSE